MVTFKIAGTFEAEDLDDAVRYLGVYFSKVSDYMDHSEDDDYPDPTAGDCRLRDLEIKALEEDGIQVGLMQEAKRLLDAVIAVFEENSERMDREEWDSEPDGWMDRAKKLSACLAKDK